MPTVLPNEHRQTGDQPRRPGAKAACLRGLSKTGTTSTLWTSSRGARIGQVAKAGRVCSGLWTCLKATPPMPSVILKLDRLSRSIRDFSWLVERVFNDKTGKVLISLQDSIDFRTASGRMVAYLLQVIAQWEREIISERTTAALAHKIAVKHELVGELQYGYDLDGKTLVPNAKNRKPSHSLASYAMRACRSGPSPASSTPEATRARRASRGTTTAYAASSNARLKLWQRYGDLCRQRERLYAWLHPFDYINGEFIRCPLAFAV